MGKKNIKSNKMRVVFISRVLSVLQALYIVNFSSRFVNVTLLPFPLSVPSAPFNVLSCAPVCAQSLSAPLLASPSCLSPGSKLQVATNLFPASLRSSSSLYPKEANRFLFINHVITSDFLTLGVLSFIKQ